MLRRIEIDGGGCAKWLAMELECTRRLLSVWCYLPQPEGHFTGLACTFWFTEEGWDTIGELTLHCLQYELGKERVKLKVIPTIPKEDVIIFKDDFQMALAA